MNGIRKQISRWKWFGLCGPLAMGGFVFLMVNMEWMVALALPYPTPLQITIGTFFPYYSPKTVRIETGTPVSWDNPTANIHSITHDGCQSGKRCAFDSGAIGPNRTFTVNHLPPGNYPYHCTFHPIMRGVIVVLDSEIPSEA